MRGRRGRGGWGRMSAAAVDVAMLRGVQGRPGTSGREPRTR